MKKQKDATPVRTLAPAPQPGSKPPKFVTVKPPEPPPLMTNVVSVFVQGIPGDSYLQCGIEPQAGKSLTTSDIRQQLAEFVRRRLELLAQLEYGRWINGQIPFVTSRELQLWRLLQFVKFIWFWDLPDDEILALIFNLTRRRATSLASDFEARFRKMILYPIALRRLYELFSTQPIKENEGHPRNRSWDGCLYRVHSDRYLGYTQTLIEDMKEFTEEPLPDATWWDADEKVMWLPTEVREIAIKNAELRQRLFDIYKEPDDDVGR